jgi:hypothetical protein
MEKKQTAVQWLFKSARLDMSIYDWLLCIEHAERMEREQIINAYVNGEHQQGFENEAEQYYNETYGKDNK